MCVWEMSEFLSEFWIRAGRRSLLWLVSWSSRWPRWGTRGWRRNRNWPARETRQSRPPSGCSSVFKLAHVRMFACMSMCVYMSVCVSVCVYMSVCVCMHMSVCVHVCARVCVHVCMCTWVCVCTCVCPHMSVCVHMCVCPHMSVCVCTWVGVGEWVCV